MTAGKNLKLFVLFSLVSTFQGYMILGSPKIYSYYYTWNQGEMYQCLIEIQ